METLRKISTSSPPDEKKADTKPLSIPAAIFRYTSSLSRAERNRFAAVLSVIPGLGHIFKGHRSAGFLILIGGNLLMIYVAFWLSLATLGIAFLLIPPLWIAGVAVAAYRAEETTGIKDSAPAINANDSEIPTPETDEQR